jgi:hypothetical protein
MISEWARDDITVRNNIDGVAVQCRLVTLPRGRSYNSGGLTW